MAEKIREIKKYVRFYLESVRSWQEESAPRNVVLFFNYNHNRLVTTTGVKVTGEDWHKDRQRVKVDAKVKRANEVNAYLDNLEQKINDIYFGALGNNIIPDNNYILKEMKKDYNQQKISLIEHWERYLKVTEVNVALKSFEALTISFNHFKKFAQGKRLDFDDIDAELVSRYADYLFGLGHVDNTVHKHIRRLRTFMAYAKRNGHHNNDKYLSFNIKAKVGRINFLTWDEVKALIDYKPENDTERKALSNFLFGCLSGMRHSDYHKLKRSEIVPYNIEKYQATFRQLKTNKLTSAPMLPEAMMIIEQNNGAKDGYALPRMSSQKINDNIKLIAEKAGINVKVIVDTFKRGKPDPREYEKWQILGTHWGRKTFISVAANRGVSVAHVAAAVGQNIKTTMKHYLGVLEKDKFDEIMSKMKFPETKNNL